jgi:O-antigen ligase
MKNIESYDELRPSGTYTKPALYASIAAITALLTLSIPYILKKHNDSKKRKILYHTIFYVVSIIIFFGIILSKTRGAMIAIAFSYFLYLFLHFLFLNRTKRLIIIFIIILILVICFLLILINIFPSILSKLESIINYFGSYEGNIRLNIYKTAWNEILEHPIIGNGPNTFHFYYQEKLYSWHSHNNYLEIAYGSGIPALITFLVMEIMLILKLIKYIINKNKKHINKIIALSILCAYITNILYGLSDYIIFAVTASPLLFFGIGLVSNIQALDNT